MHTRKQRLWKYIVEVFSERHRSAVTPSPLTRNPASKFVLGDVLYYIDCTIIL